MKCAELFCEYQQELGGEYHAEFTMAEFTMESVTKEDRKGIPAGLLVEGELELLLERASRALDFAIQPMIMRTPEIPAHLRESALAFAMISHRRLGQWSTLHALPGDLLQRVSESAMGRAWNKFKEDVYYKDFVALVALHLKPGEKHPHKVLTVDHSCYVFSSFLL